MTALELLLTALDERYEKYRAERQRCKDEFSEEAVHDLRVATRRILALSELLRAIDAHPRLKKLRRDFKEQLDSLDTLRDTQVMLVEISKTIAELPGLAPLQKSLQKREKRLLESAGKSVREFKSSKITQRIGKVRAGLAGKAADSDLTVSLLTAVDDVYETVTRRKGQIDPAQPATIHHTRVAFKKFRYMVEIIHPLLPDFPVTLLKSMHAYQTSMGNIQDVEVMLQTLADFATRHDNYDPQPLSVFYRQRHAELIDAYIEIMNEAATFWRETPEKPFPWEKN